MNLTSFLLNDSSGGLQTKYNGAVIAMNRPERAVKKQSVSDLQ
jgi:hypothetical protein